MADTYDKNFDDELSFNNEEEFNIGEKFSFEDIVDTEDAADTEDTFDTEDIKYEIDNALDKLPNKARLYLFKLKCSKFGLATQINSISRIVPGLVLVLVVSFIADKIGSIFSVVGAPVIAIVIGMIISAVRPVSEKFKGGIRFSSKKLLQLAVILLGTGLSFKSAMSIGFSSLPVMLGTMTVALGGAFIFGKLLKTDSDLTTMVGVGTGICGASAVAVVSGIIEPEENDVSYAISTIFVFNVLAVLLYPTIGHILHLNQKSFGLWAGTAINDVSSVVAAGYTFGHIAGAHAVVVKLSRTLLIVPIAIVLSILNTNKKSLKKDYLDKSIKEQRSSKLSTLKKAVPWFVVWFIFALVLRSINVIPTGLLGMFSSMSQFLIVMALAAIGLSSNFRSIRQTGHRPLILGAILWASVGISSLILQLVFHQL